jgi:hypothetical protein
MECARIGRNNGLVGRRLRRPECAQARGVTLPSRTGAGDRITHERGTITGGDGALRRQCAGCRAARNTFADDECRDRGFVLVLTHDLTLYGDYPDRYQGNDSIDTRISFNFTEKGESIQIIYAESRRIRGY